MSVWTIQIKRTDYNVSDERWHWSIWEDGRLPNAGFCAGYASTKRRATKRAEKQIERIIKDRKKSKEKETFSYTYTPVGDGRET